jgi:hypothetical protein
MLSWPAMVLPSPNAETTSAGSTAPPGGIWVIMPPSRPPERANKAAVI